MALRRALSKRILSLTTPHSPSPVTTLVQSPPPPPPSIVAPPKSDGFFRRFLQREAINHHSDAFPSFLTFPLGEKKREKLKSMDVVGDQRLRLDGLSPPLREAPAEEKGFSVAAADVKKVMKFVQLEKVREKLRNIPASTMSYGEFVRVCGDGEMGLEFAKALDECGNVVVLGGVVFLRPDQVAKSMEKLISQSIAMPNDPRRKELDNLETQKALIDETARSSVQRELYCGLGFLGLQILGFMRLTFWELNWDVMEPICFFVTSIHFVLAYAFFLRTSKEPSFEGYFQRRFKVKQMKLMKVQNFDVERYNHLCEVFYAYRRKE